MSGVFTDTFLPDAQRRKAMARIDDRVVECRGERHPWPVPKIGKPLPKGIVAEPLTAGMSFREGGYRLVVTCPNCHRVRTTTCSPGQFTGRRHQYTGGWEPEPELSRSDFVAERDERLAEALDSMAATRAQLVVANAG